jgi:hypothetical protein
LELDSCVFLTLGGTSLSEQRKKWRTDRFPIKHRVTDSYVGRHLDSTASDADAKKMVGTIMAEKVKVKGILEKGIEDYVGLMAEVTGATYQCKYGGNNEGINCYTRKDLVVSWNQNGDELNTKRMAFIWYFASLEIYQTANLGSHEEWLEEQILREMQAEYYPLPGPGERKSCVRTLYSLIFNNHRYNVFRNLSGDHDNMVQISHPKDADLGMPRNYRREKEQFFVRTRDCRQGTDKTAEWAVVSLHRERARGRGNEDTNEMTFTRLFSVSF